MSLSKFIKGWETCLAVGLMNIYISLFCNKTLLLFGHRFITIMKIYIFYYEVLIGQSRIINGPSDFHQKEKMKKRKNPQKVFNPLPLIHLEVVNINFNFEGPALL
jgi:hypothetical protein